MNAWGKLKKDDVTDVVIARLSLTDHCADVAQVVTAILRVPIWKRVLARLANVDEAQFDEVTIQRIGVMAFLHDLGKANWGFQNKDGSGKKVAGHVKEVVSLFKHLSSSAEEALDLTSLFKWGSKETVNELFCACLSHHGYPFNPQQEDNSEIFWRPRHDGYDPIQALSQLTAEARRLFPLAFDGHGPNLPDTPAFQHGFAGLMQLADWLGSDTAFFPLSAREHIQIDAARVITDVGLDVAAFRSALLEHRPAFRTIFSFDPNAMQVSSADTTLGSLVILEAETGAGKTEAALWRFQTLFASREVDGLYFALPTRVAATQIHNRIVKSVERLFPDPTNRPPVVLALPGYLKVDESKGKSLPGFEVLWEDNPTESEAHSRWAAESPKRFLTSTIAIGTIDQALLAALRVRHAHLRAFSLARSLLVVDEVHASDTYMREILAQLIHNHRQAGGHVLLMSATLGSEARHRYLANTPNSPPIPITEATIYPYPCITPSIGSPIPIITARKEKTVTVELAPIIDEPKSIALRALEAARLGAKVLVIRNTVSAALCTQQELESICSENEPLLFRCCNVVTLHHSRFARDDRSLLDNAVETSLGKERPTGGKIIIGTQTLEQSLDIDADLLLTDLCPIDVLLQRVGRLHRHQRERPPSFQSEARLVVLTPTRDLTSFLSKSRHGLGRYVYDDLTIIEATLRELESHSSLEIPSMNRKLVERATHSSCLDKIAASLGPEWIRHRQELRGKNGAERTHAIYNLLNYGIPFGSGDSLFPGCEETISTRLGLSDRLAAFPSEISISSPFGSRIKTITIPGHLAKEIPLEAEVTNVEQNQGAIHFQFGQKAFVYDRLGLRLHTMS